jgi:catechol 2,3-dioxygenase-like lactoylglutathione lyase family enzyme
VFDHISFGVRDLARATTFYTRVLGTLGYKLQRQLDAEVAFGPDNDWTFVLYPAEPGATVAGARMHLAFRATSRAAVHAFYATALQLGATVLPDRAPDVRPQFGDDYFGAVLQDLDGHMLEVMTRQGT